MTHDNVNHPKHYTSHPSGIECIQVTEHMGFNLGNAVKYCFRSGEKSAATEVEDLRKAVWYARRELGNLSLRFALRGFGSRSRAQQGWSNQDAGADQGRVLDPNVFFSQEAALCARNGSGDVCGGATSGDDGVPPERKQAGQPCCEFGMGVTKAQHQSQDPARNGAGWQSEVVVQADGRAGDLGKNMRSFGVESCCPTECLQGAGQPYTPWRELGAYLAYEPDAWRRQAVHGLVSGRIVDAISAIEREIQKRIK